MSAQQMVEDILAEAEYIEFPDSSGQSNHLPEDEQWINLTHVQQAQYAGNNCFGATMAVMEYVTETIGVDPQQSLHCIETLFSSGVHWANMVRDAETGVETVIDFTARQFDASVPFPCVLPREEWMEWVKERVATLHGDTLTEVNVDFGQN